MVLISLEKLVGKSPDQADKSPLPLVPSDKGVTMTVLKEDKTDKKAVEKDAPHFMALTEGIDGIVAHRQKKKGMAWSRAGSKALAIIKTYQLNKAA